MMDLFVHGFDIVSLTNNVFYVIIVFIIFDILTGLLVAGKERKINSSINLEGLIRKLGLLIGLAFASFIDVYFKADGYIVKASVGVIIVYEGISIIENLSKIGVNLKFLTRYFDPKKVESERKDKDD